MTKSKYNKWSIYSNDKAKSINMYIIFEYVEEILKQI